ncbi:hypothetical protein KSP39_PZI022271 [Platanthera zijinensis]|uniref:Uncharacterized protein n=1 Tax=Platanthera zijinensis TaxID=2320716 RepID=A0AAP0AWL8_9ASPA
MATEVLSVSPRLSFSDDISLDAIAGDDCNRSDGFLPLEAGSGDFNFNVIFQSSISDSSDAGELFSGGKLLPVFKATVPTENNSGPLPQPIGDSLGAISDSTAGSGGRAGTAACHRHDNSRPSIWRFGRSSSVSSVTPTSLILTFPLHRSKSTGSFPLPSPRPPLAAANKASSKKLAVDLNQRKTYYYSGSKRGSHRSGVGGVRISPVLNVPAPMILRGDSGSSGSSATVSNLFSYLLCSCGSEEKREELESADSNSTKRNGTRQLRGVNF